MSWYALAADVVVTLHLLYLLFTVGGAVAIIVGAALRWRWIRNRLFRIVHLAAVLVVAIEAIAGIWCPLTVWEHRLRRMAGRVEEEQISFVARLVRSVLFYDFPGWFFLALYVAFGALVAATFLLVPPRGQRNR